MPWTQARDFLAAHARIRRDTLQEMAVAVRAGMADEKGWRAWIENVRKENR